MGVKLDHLKETLREKRRMPGPGSYRSNDLTGKEVTISEMINGKKSSVPKANDRFKLYNYELPPPNTYTIKNSLNKNYNSKHTNDRSTVFGTNKRTFIHESWRLDQGKSTPGPGNYTVFSDFNGPN